MDGYKTHRQKRGIKRIRNGWFEQDSVVLDFEGYGFMEVPEEHYRKQRYLPDIDELPWGERAAPKSTKPDRSSN
jgi:hypothetical protein